MTEPPRPPASDDRPSAAQPDPDQPPRSDAYRRAEAELLRRYWRENIITMLVLLGVWALAGLGCGILFADWLNQFRLPGTGYPLGFWFAQQGSIIIFVLIIFIYAVRMNMLDKRHHRDLAAVREQEAA